MNTRTESSLENEPILLSSDQNLFKVVGEKDLNRKAIATCVIKEGQVIHNIEPYLIKKEPDFLTVQINSEEHLLDSKLEGMNHSCSPTTFVDVERLQVIAEKNISPGDELTFFYPSTEWEMNRPFQCKCQSSHCIGIVAGAKNLSISQLSNFHLNLHIKKSIKDALNLD